MTLFKGISYNFRGLMLGLKTPSLLMLGFVRMAVILFLSLIAIGLVLSKYQEITSLIWSQPDSLWILWLWHVVSWLLALLLAAISTLLAFLISQILFSIVIMDYMSRITERLSTGSEAAPPSMPWPSYFIYLLKQEVPRAVVPIVISMGLMLVGWFTPLSPILTILSPILAGIFLAWDNTDLVPARRLEPFRNRLRFLRQNLRFHLGFGLGFLIPGLNILLLSFAPVGATLFYVENIDSAPSSSIENLG
ncbi:MAG: EI24 domain-containing protein [Desulfobacteraceae bacterium]|jgi:CysZ protein